MHNVLEQDMARLTAQADLTPLRGKSVLITGAGGMLASYLALALDWYSVHRDGNVRLGLLARSRQRAEKKLGEILAGPHVTLLEQDVCAPIVTDERYDYIIHAAGAADPRSIVERPFEVIAANTVGTANVCALAREQGSEILFLSTREIYGAADAPRLREDMAGALDPMAPRSCYPESKRCAEAMLAAAGREYGVPCKIARIAHVYGPGMNIENDGRIMADMMGDMVHGRDQTLHSAGEMKRAFCYISDAAAALLLVLLRGEAGRAYNVANETEEIAVAELARRMAERTGRQVVFDLPKSGNAAGYFPIPRVPLDTAALEALGWRPQVALAEGIERTYRYFTER